MQPGDQVTFHLADHRQQPRIATVRTISENGDVLDLDLQQGLWPIPIYGVQRHTATDPADRFHTYYKWEPIEPPPAPVVNWPGYDYLGF